MYIISYKEEERAITNLNLHTTLDTYYHLPILSKRQFAHLEKCIQNRWYGKAWQLVRKLGPTLIKLRVSDSNQLTKSERAEK